MSDSELNESADALRDLLQQSAPTRFEAGFDDRVMARLSAVPTLQLLTTEDTLLRAGRRWLPWLAAAAALLATLDRRATQTDTASLTTASSEASGIAVPDWSAYQ